MVNTGKPSSGCGLCRRRRVKCDERAGGCLKCERYGKLCPGYPDQSDLFFRHSQAQDAREFRQNTSAVEPYSPVENDNSLAAIRQASNARDLVDDWRVVSRDSSTSPGLLGRAQFGQPTCSNLLTLDLEQRSVCASLTLFETYCKIHDLEALRFVAPALQRAENTSCLFPAFTTLALTDWANRHNLESIKLQDRVEYGRAIEAVNAALGDPKRRLEDDTLIAVWFLHIKELLLEFDPSACGLQSAKQIKAARLRRQSHIDGTLALLRLRGEVQFSTKSGRQLFATIVQGMHWKALFECEPPSKDLIYLEGLLPKTHLDPESSRTLRQYFNDVTHLRWKIKTFLEHKLLSELDPKGDAQQIRDILATADRVAADGQSWRSASQPWHPSPPFLTDVDRARYSDSLVFMKYHFTDFPAFWHWNRFLVATILLHEALLRLLLFAAGQAPLRSMVSDASRTTARGNLLSQRTAYHEQSLRRFLTDFIGTIAHAFGDFDRHGRLRGIFSRSDSDRSHSGEQYEINVTAVLQIYPPLVYFNRPAFGCMAEIWQVKGVEQALKRIKCEFAQP